MRRIFIIAINLSLLLPFCSNAQNSKESIFPKGKKVTINFYRHGMGSAPFIPGYYL